ncbi:hypothetical protein B0H13DRAFT_2282183 [Mycena leptocephala]|nr:hypothetical protein B0H13DRAFT_2282183 [Mycena leptocephala]
MDEDDVRAAAKAGDALDQVLTKLPSPQLQTLPTTVPFIQRTELRLDRRRVEAHPYARARWELSTDFDFGHGSCSGDLDFDKRHSRGWGVAWTHDQRVRACQMWIARDGLADGWIPGIDAARSRMGVYESTLGATGAAWTNTAAARTGVAHSCGPLVDAHRCAERDDRADGRVVELDGSCSYVHPSTRTGTRVYGGEYGKVEARASGRCRTTFGSRCGLVREGSRMRREGTTQRRCDDTGYIVRRVARTIHAVGRRSAFIRESRRTCTSLAIAVGLSLALPTPPYVRPTLLETQGRIDPSFIVSSIFGLGLGLRWGFTGRGFGRRLGGKDGSNTSSLDTHSSYSHSARVPHGPPSAHLRYPTASSVRALSSIQITIQIIWRARPRQQTSRTSRLLTPLRSVGWERADRPSRAGCAAGVRVRCLSNSPGNTAPHFTPPLPGLDVARRAAYSLVHLLRCLRVCKYTRRIRMRVLATHIKHAMSRKIEWAPLPALVHLCTRAPPIVRLRLPAHPVRNTHRSIPPVSGLLHHHASLGLHLHPSFAPRANSPQSSGIACSARLGVARSKRG